MGAPARLVPPIDGSVPGIAEGGRAYIQQEKFFQDFFWWNFSQDFLCAALCGVTVPMRAYDPRLDFAIASLVGEGAPGKRELQPQNRNGEVTPTPRVQTVADNDRRHLVHSRRIRVPGVSGRSPGALPFTMFGKAQRSSK